MLRPPDGLTDDPGLAILSPFDAEAIGAKVVEMADRLVDVDAALPGSRASIDIDLDDKRFRITVTRIRKGAP
jgi:hypothetical protein